MPEAIFSASDICISDSFYVTNLSKGATNYLWSFGDGTTSTVTQPSHKYTSEGTYYVKLTATGIGQCKDSLITQIKVYSLPQLIIRDSISERNVKFVVSDSLFATYKWSFGDGGSSTDANPFHRYPAIGKYNVSLKVTNAQGCSQNLTHSLQILTNSITPHNNLEQNVKVFPNPFDKHTTLEYDLDITSKVEIKLYDINARELLLKYAINESPGKYNVIIDSDKLKLKSGLYLLKLEINGLYVNRKIIKLE